jgi:hypothetical protein
VTPELRIEVEGAALERIAADVAGVALFQDERPLRGGAGRADWRLCGRISALVAEGRLRGEPGEAALVTTFGGMRARLLLVLGAGPREDFDARAFEGLVQRAVAHAFGLRAGRLALCFAEGARGHAASEARATGLVAGAAAAAGAAPPGTELELVLSAAPEEVGRAIDLLRRARPGPLREPVVLRLSTAGIRGGRAPARQVTPRPADPSPGSPHPNRESCARGGRGAP